MIYSMLYTTTSVGKTTESRALKIKKVFRFYRLVYCVFDRYSYSGRLRPRQVFESQTGVETGFRVTRDWIHDLIFARGFALTLCWIFASYRTVHASIITFLLAANI